MLFRLVPTQVPGFKNGSALPLHASRAANDGCWWEPFGAKTQGFELPIQRCSNPANNSTFEETATGLSYREGTNDAATAYTIYSKTGHSAYRTGIKAEVFNRRGVAQNLSAANNPLSLDFAIPDHPWLKALSTDEHSISKAAAVRIAMTVAEVGDREGHLTA